MGLGDGKNSPLSHLRNLISPVQSQVSFEGVDCLLRIAEHLKGLLGLHPPDLHFFDVIPFAKPACLPDVPFGAIGVDMRVISIAALYDKLHRYPRRLPADNIMNLLADEKLSANSFHLEIFTVQQATDRSPASML
jgi:hypothetical protein